MHTMLANGVMSVELHTLFSSLRQSASKFTFAMFREWVGADGVFPRGRIKINVPEVFSNVREQAGYRDGMFKASASETLTVYPLIRYFVEVVVAPLGLVPAERDSFLACCHTMDTLQNMIKHDIADLAELLPAIRAHFRAYVKAYGSDGIRPKHHYMWHMGE